MILKNFLSEKESNLSFNKAALNNIIIDSSKSKKTYFYDIYTTSNFDILFELSRKYPSSLILFYTKQFHINLPDNIFIISPTLITQDAIQLNNILTFSKKIKESYFRKTIIQIKDEVDIHKIYNYLKHLGFKLKIYSKKDITEKNTKLKKILKSKNRSIIKTENKNILGFYIKDKFNIYYFETLWHPDSEINRSLINELISGILKSKFFNTKDKQKSSNINIITLKEKEIFLGEHIGEGLFVLDLNFKITFVNKTFKRMFLIKNQNLIGKNIKNVILSTRNENFLNDCKFKTISQISLIIKTEMFGTKRFYNIAYSPIKDHGNLKAICGVIRNITLLKKMENEVKISNLNSEVMNRKLISVQSATIFGFSKIAEYKDQETGRHLERIQNYVKILAYELYKNMLFKNNKTGNNYLNDDYIEEISLSSLLHDIGKVGIPDKILLKPGRLNKDEFKHMQLHTNIGGDTLKFLDDMVGEVSYLALAKEVAYYHHEKWNGNGYPFGKIHEDIPLSARITAVCDVYDALRSERPYKKSYSHEKSCEIIYDSSGSHFDPVIISIFSSVEKQFKHISNKYSD